MQRLRDWLSGGDTEAGEPLGLCEVRSTWHPDFLRHLKARGYDTDEASDEAALRRIMSGIERDLPDTIRHRLAYWALSAILVRFTGHPKAPLPSLRRYLFYPIKRR